MISIHLFGKRLTVLLSVFLSGRILTMDSQEIPSKMSYNVTSKLELLKLSSFWRALNMQRSWKTLAPSTSLMQQRTKLWRRAGKDKRNRAMECSCTYCFSYVIETFLGMKCDEGEVVIGDRSKIWPFVKMLSTSSTTHLAPIRASDCQEIYL